MEYKYVNFSIITTYYQSLSALQLILNRNRIIEICEKAKCMLTKYAKVYFKNNKSKSMMVLMFMCT